MPDLYEGSGVYSDRFDEFNAASLFNTVLPTNDILTPPLDPYPSTSSHSEASPPLPAWQRPNRQDFYDQNNSEEFGFSHCSVSLTDVQQGIGAGIDAGFDVGRYYMDLDVYEGARINHALAGLIGKSVSLNASDNIAAMEDLYSQSFWEHFHASFPILHVPSYQVAEASPLLRALTVAIGACVAESSPQARIISRVIRDTIDELLQKV